MIDSLEELESDMRIAKGGGLGTPTLKSVMNTSGEETFTLMPASRYGKREKVHPQVATEYISKHKSKLATIGYNKASTTLYIRIK